MEYYLAYIEKIEERKWYQPDMHISTYLLIKAKSKQEAIDKMEAAYSDWVIKIFETI